MERITRESPLDRVTMEAIITALMSIDTEVGERLGIEITKLVEQEDDEAIYLSCDFNAMHKSGKKSYNLSIFRHNKQHNVNPEAIALIQRGKSMGHFMPLGHVGQVTDILRKYNVW